MCNYRFLDYHVCLVLVTEMHLSLEMLTNGMCG